MAISLVGLGSNLGDRAATLKAALERLSAEPGVESVAPSRNFPSRPIGGPPGQGEFLNAAARVATSLGPQALLGRLLAIESDLGRRRDVRWGPRTIDLDLLLYDDVVEESRRLVLPHPRLAVRRFVLEPAAEVAAELVHPTIQWTIGRLLAHACEHPRYLALAGPIGVGKTQLARQLAAAAPERLGQRCQLLEERVDDVQLARFYADPSGQAWRTELEFLRERTALLSGRPRPEDRGWLASDFWFAQSLAYADLWLAPQERPALTQEYQAAEQLVLRPKLLIVLEAPTAELRRRITSRGRPYEQQTDDATIERLRQGIDRLSRRPGLGPVLRFGTDEPQALVDEAIAALAGME